MSRRGRADVGWTVAWIGTALAVALGLGRLMPYGPGLRDDSYTYLSAAETIAETGIYARRTAEGEFRPVTNFPPLYSLSLAGVGKLGVGSLEAARLLNQVLGGGLVLVVGWLVAQATRSRWTSAAAVVLVVLSPPLSLQFTWALSEPLFLVLEGVGIGCAYLWLTQSADRRWLVFTGVVLGLAALTRYAGVGLILGLVAALLLRPGTPIRARIGRSLVLAALSIGPLIVFLIRNLIVTGNALNRPSPAWHPPSVEAWASGAGTVLRWLLPDRVVAWVGDEVGLALATVGVLVVTGFGLTVLRWPGPRGDAGARDPEFIRALSAGLLGYIVTIVLTVVLVDRLTPLNDRLLAPALLILVLLAVGVGWQALRSRPGWQRALLWLAFVGYVGLQVPRQLNLISALSADGQGYSAREWRESEVLRYLCSLPDVPVFTNDLPAVYFACGRLARPLPFPRNLASQTANPDYAMQVDALEAAVRDQGGVVAIVGWYGEQRLEELWMEEILASLKPLVAFDDGIVYSQ